MVDEDLKLIRSSMFGSATVGVPRTFLQLVRKYAVIDKPFIGLADHAKGEFRAYWIDGRLFRSVIFTGDAHTAAASEFAYRLSALSSFTATYSFEYDEFTRMHNQWNRVVTLTFGENETVIIEIQSEAGEDTDRSKFVDTVVQSASEP